jgi:hypothetical protein
MTSRFAIVETKHEVAKLGMAEFHMRTFFERRHTNLFVDCFDSAMLCQQSVPIPPAVTHFFAASDVSRWPPALQPDPPEQRAKRVDQELSIDASAFEIDDAWSLKEISGGEELGGIPLDKHP